MFSNKCFLRIIKISRSLWHLSDHQHFGLTDEVRVYKFISLCITIITDITLAM